MGGSTVNPVKVNAGSKVTEPKPTKANATFLGWFTDKACTKKFDFNSPVNSDITLYAKWDELVYTYTVTPITDPMGATLQSVIKVYEGHTDKEITSLLDVVAGARRVYTEAHTNLGAFDASYGGILVNNNRTSEVKAAKLNGAWITLVPRNY